jgi:hypothetical protein
MGNENGKANTEKARRMTMPRIEWFWNASLSGWSHGEKAKWNRYSEIEMEIIEEAFQEHQNCVELDQYIVDFRSHIQKNKKDPGKQRQIKRVVVDREQQCLRERFFIQHTLSNPPLSVSFPPADISNSRPRRSFSEGGSSFPEFVDHWRKKYLDISLPATVEQAAKGIIVEGEKLELFCEAQWLAKQLRKYKHKEQGEICKNCLSLYTRESFLYKLVNKTLREDDRTKIDTLGAFCYLLFYCPATEQLMEYHYKGLVYRGLNLELSDIEAYKNAINTGYKCWLGFSSTSQNRKKAEGFGNTLLIIDIKYAIDSLDISSISVFPEEEEVLLSASQLFKVDKVEYNENTKQYEIYISVWWAID